MPRINGAAVLAVSITDADGTARDIKKEVKDISWGNDINMLDTTTVDVDQMQREEGLKDSNISVNFFLNTDAGSTYDVFCANQSNERTMKVSLRSDCHWNIIGLIENVNPSRDTSTEFSLEATISQSKGPSGTSSWSTS